MVDEDVSLPPLRLGWTVLAVAAGGAIGTLIRAEILTLQSTPPSLDVPSVAAHPWTAYVPWWLLVVNTFGVLVAAWLLAGPLRGRSPDDNWRLFALTGFLGGLTSYSALIRDVDLIKAHSIVGATVTLVGAIVVGVFAAALGVLTARLTWP